MSIVTSSKQSSTDLESAVKDFLRQADVTVVPARKRKRLSKSAIAARERAIKELHKAQQAQELAALRK